MTCSGVYSRSLSRRSFSQIAARNSGMPGVCVYLVKPAARAETAACLMCSGVSKSGSPATRLSTSTPLAVRALTFAFCASVCDGLIGWRRRARFMCTLVPAPPDMIQGPSRRGRRGEPRLRLGSAASAFAELDLQLCQDVGGHQALDAAAERCDFAHEFC